MPNGIAKLHFERSGGFVAFGQPLSADVVFSPTPSVVDAGGKASRPLSAAETAIFAQLDPARLRAFVQARQSRPAPSVPDDYQYDLTFSFADGNSIKLTFGGQSVGELRGLPALASLAAWVQTEADAILSRR